ncbi:Serine/threonine-protein kinase PBS1 [Theobroma cacao]|uniref:Serine/threonine-protein kinase PBS1 n=1 Tax=Theobroma cacao TaxID=3641 RepID=A0A061DWM0_THECC|nr:Serine/threonine-protein kinase PBS1 [Theobroma cacao]
MEILGLKIKFLLQTKTNASDRHHDGESDSNIKWVPDGLQEVIPAASRDQLPIAIDGEADLIGQEMAKDDEIDLVLQEIQMLENAPDGPLLAMANNQEGWRLKDVLTWVFPITSFTLELPSAVFDQLSSKDHSHYAHIVMLISFIALVACIAELIYKGKKERVTWQPRDRVPWFHCRQTGKPFCSLWEIIGFACAFLQCVVTAINYSFISRHLDGPIKTSALPILFAFGLLCSKYFEKPGRNRGGRPDGGSEADLVQVRVEP